MLQKYRLYLQKLKDDARQKTEHLAPLRPPQEVPPHPQVNLLNEFLKNTYPNQQDLLTQLQRARTVRSMIRSSQLSIVTRGFQNLPVPVEAYQNKSLTTQMADHDHDHDQTPTCEQIWNEIKGDQGRLTNLNANKIHGHDQVLDEKVVEIDGSTCNPKSEFSGSMLHDTPLRDTSGDFSLFFKNNSLRRSSGDCGLLLNEYTLFRDNSEDYSSLWNEMCTPSQG